MAHIEKNSLKSGRTSYTVRYRDHADTEQRKTFRTMADAKAFRSEIDLAKSRGTSVAAFQKNAQTFREVAVSMVKAQAHRQKDKTQDSYDLAYRVHIYPTFGERRINSITSLDVEAWLGDMRTKVSERTGRPLAESSIHGCWIALGAVFKYAMKHQLISANPCRAVDKPKVTKRERRFLLPGEVRQIAALLDATPPYGLIVRFAANTGLREGELAALRIGDVSLVHKVVRVRRTLHRVKGGWRPDTPKSARSSRDVPLSRALVEELAAYLAQHPHATDPTAQLWPGRIPGGGGDVRALDYDRQFDVASLIRYYFKPACAQLGLTGVRWHDLRHFYASALLATKRYSLFDVSRWMGHASYATTTDVYGHLLDTRPDMDALDDLMAGSPEPTIARVTPLRATGS